MSSTYSTETPATPAAARSDPHAPLLSPHHWDPASTAQLAMPGRQRGGPVLSRDTAAREQEEQRVDCGYSKSVVALDMMWNAAFVALSVVMLPSTMDEKPNTPIRLWVCCYALLCMLHVVFVWWEYRWSNTRTTSAVDEERGDAAAEHVNDSEDEENGIEMSLFGSNQSSVAKRCESLNTMVSFLWCIVGFYWVVSGGDILLQNAPRLYWLVVVFLAFDVFFAVICVVLACLIGIALCCCLPCIVAILYAVAKQEGATEADLSVLVKYRFQIINNGEKPYVGAGKMVPVEMSGGYLANEHLLLPEDAECCICLSSYEDGVDLHSLPCNHHFHSTCILRWLKTNATCPLCKYNILKGNEHL
ncbi:hypothetical protein CXB51_010648 [Gossypium anomalum]|uniref:RING-type E3 ubiquitin transferase n=1 Tax=Gossypium anomalum TaxID=47600 RepID=A0A8J6D279_9ROSI|nr:hypothetical protein CXB51_010648 [Gossypium anomalum]